MPCLFLVLHGWVVVQPFGQVIRRPSSLTSMTTGLHLATFIGLSYCCGAIVTKKVWYSNHKALRLTRSLCSLYYVVQDLTKDLVRPATFMWNVTKPWCD